MRSTLDEVLEKVNILDVVSQYVTLRRAGKDFLGLCPFHKEKTPSFTVSTEKQIYYCFGCHQGGNAVNFLMASEHLSFQEALESLARQYGIQVQSSRGTRKPHLQDALGKLAEHYQRGLRDSKQAKEYLLRRGIDKGTVDTFRVGYSAPVNHTLKEFLKDSGIPKDIFLATGVIKLREKDLYDIFRGRIVIPIVDVTGKVIGFGGRGIEKNAVPKYINSPESAAFTKRYALFGIDKTKKHIVDKNEAILVEGYFDLIALYQGGLRNVVSTLGTAVTEEQLIKLRSYTENITLMLDGDAAGVKSALRLIPLISELDLTANMVLLPADEDPDSYMGKHGIEATEQMLESRRPLLDYCFDYYMDRYRLENLDGRMAFVKTVLPLVEGIKNGVKKRLYVKRLSQLTGVEEEHFYTLPAERGAEGVKKEKGGGNTIERQVVGALLNNPSLLGLFHERGGVDLMVDGDVREVVTSMAGYSRDKRHLEAHEFIGTLEREDLRDLVAKAAFDVQGYDEDQSRTIVTDYLSHMTRKVLRERAREITEKLSEAEKSGDEGKVRELLRLKKQVLSSMKPNM